jgi:hypothetical protein
MNVAYARLNGRISFQPFASNYVRGTRLRCGMLNSMLKQGTEIKLYSETESVGFFVVSSLPRFQVELSEKPKEDILFIENGSSNALYSFKRNGENVSYLKRIAELIDGFKGKIFYYQQDGRLSFPFKYFENFKENIVVLTHAEDLKRFVEIEYKGFENRVEARNIPLCFDEENYPSLNFNMQPSYDLVYVGNEHDSNRKRKLEKFYSGTGLKTTVFGEWERVPFGITYEKEPPFGMTERIYNKAICSVQIADKHFEEYRMPTTRIIEVIQAGCCLLIDSDLKLENYVPNKYAVENNYEVLQFLNLIKQSPEKRKEINEEQKKKLKHWDEVNWTKVLS